MALGRLNCICYGVFFRWINLNVANSADNMEFCVWGHEMSMFWLLFLGSAITSTLFQRTRCKCRFFVWNQMRIYGFQFLQRKRLLCSCLPEKPSMNAILKTDNFQACSITRKRADVNTTVVWYFNWRHAKFLSKGSVSNKNNHKLAEKCCTSKKLLTWKIANLNKARWDVMLCVFW